MTSARLWDSIVSDCRDACSKILSWKCQALHKELFSLIQNQVRSASDWLDHWDGQHSLEAEQQTYLGMHKLLVVLELVKAKMEAFSSMFSRQTLPAHLRLNVTRAVLGVTCIRQLCVLIQRRSAMTKPGVWTAQAVPFLSCKDGYLPV